MYPAQEQNFLQRHCYGGQGFLVAEEGLVVTEEVLLVVEDRFVFFVYRLALDAKPDRGML